MVPVVAGSNPVSHPILPVDAFRKERTAFDTAMDPLEERIGYQFNEPQLMAESLTHPSLAYESRKPHFDNQRLEYLGDAVIQLVLTHELFRRYPKFSEGKLTKLRSQLVSREALCNFSNVIDLGAHLRLGKGEEANGGRERPSNLADAFEALAGAIYLDSGIESVKTFLFRNLGTAIEELIHQSDEPNPKGALQERLQAISPSSPTYNIVSQEGPDHQKSFVAEVVWEGKNLGTGTGSSKKEAETAAAMDALDNESWEG